MKLVKFVIISFLALFLFASCTQTQQTTATQAPASALDNIIKKGELVVGTSGNMPPMSMITKDNELIGYEIDLAQSIAKAMGVKLKLELIQFSDLLSALQSGKIDMILSNMTITPARNTKVAFVGPYFVSGKAFLTKVSTIALADEAADVNNPDTKLTALKGSTSQAFVENFIPKATLTVAKDYDEAVKMVIDDKVSAMVADYPICIISVFRYPEAGLLSVVTPLTYEPIGIAIPKGDAHFANWLQNAINNWSESGYLDELKYRWFGRGTWLNKLP
jgi:polar amino acid transport system substrate-binding protein